MGRTACTEPQCLYKGDLYLHFFTTATIKVAWTRLIVTFYVNCLSCFISDATDFSRHKAPNCSTAVSLNIFYSIERRMKSHCK